jgi:TonB family protein
VAGHLVKLIYKSQVVAATCLLLFSGLISPGATHNAGDHRASGQDKQIEWQRYSADDEEFSVLLPIRPMMSTSSVSISLDTKRRERILAAYADGVVYVIFTYERRSLTVDDLVGEFSKRDTYQQSEPVTVSGVKGKSFRFEDNDRLREIQFFATSRNLYVFKAVGSKLGNPAVGIPRFLSSIRFGKDHGGITVADGPGEQPGANTSVPANDSTIFSSRQVTLRTSVIIKPEPGYTQEARMHRVTGTVVLRGVFSSSGELTNITVLRSLPEGLTERAILVAKQIRFVPAIKDGRFVSVWIQLEYNFNLY